MGGRWIRVCQRFQLDAADNADDADERQTTPRDVGDQWSEKRSDAPAQNGGLCFPRAVEKEEEREEEKEEKEEELIQADRPNI